MESARQHRDQQLQALIKQVRAREYPYQPPPSKKRDWASYDAAQTHEIDDTLRGIRDAVDAIPVAAIRRGPGRPREYVAHDLAKAILMAQYFEASDRVAQGYAIPSLWRLSADGQFGARHTWRLARFPASRSGPTGAHPRW